MRKTFQYARKIGNMFSVNEGISILLKDKKVVLSQSWLFLNDKKKNEGQNNIGYRKLEKFLEKEHWEKSFAHGQDFFKIGFNFN